MIQTQNELLINFFSNAEYQQTYEAMLNTTLERIAKKKQGISTPDELWIVEHQDVYTLGQGGKESHILARNDTPIIKTDRGGQITWHGTGQLVMYWLFDLTALNWKVRDLVSHAEQAIEDVINDVLNLRVTAKARQDAPGVYLYATDRTQEDTTYPVHECEAEHMIGKIASLGFKLKQGFSYHGIAVNISCDLSPFSMINPCGYAGMQMVRVIDFITTDVAIDNCIIDNAITYNHTVNNIKNNTVNNHEHDECEPLELRTVKNNITAVITDMLIRNISSRHSNMTPLRN